MAAPKLVAVAALLLAVGAGGAATGVTVDEEGVIHQRGGAQPEEFDLDKLRAVHSGTHDQLDAPGVGTSYRIHYDYEGKRISPWHDIPLFAKGSTADDQLFHFICEIPKGETAKMEVHKSYPYNPVAQDHKKGKARFYKYGPSLVNYGAITQTWEDPGFITPDTGAGGDNDPVDVLQINGTPCKPGEVMPVRVLGTLALVDGGETDWKLIVADARDMSTSSMQDIGDVDSAKVSEMREWFRNYKTAEGKGLNKFGLDEKAMDRRYAEKVVLETHESWLKLVEAEELEPRCPPSVDYDPKDPCLCMFDDDPCWIARHEMTRKSGNFM